MKIKHLESKDSKPDVILGKGLLTLLPGISKVMFNGRATIVMWKDGTKTIVKDYDKRDVSQDGTLRWSGLALAICKKLYGRDDFKKMFEDITSETTWKCNPELNSRDSKFIVTSLVAFLVNNVNRTATLVMTNYCCDKVFSKGRCLYQDENNGIQIVDLKYDGSIIEINGLNNMEKNLVLQQWDKFKFAGKGKG